MNCRDFNYLVVAFFLSFGAIAQSSNQIMTNGGQLVCNRQSYNNPTCLVGENDMNFSNSNPVLNNRKQRINDPNSINDAEVIFQSDQFENEPNLRNFQTYPGNIPDRFEYSDPNQMRTDPYETMYPDPYGIQNSGSMSVYDID